MTYCVGLLVDDGLVMMADTRTNAGVDNVSTYRKLRVFGNDGERLIVIASAGSLSTTQAAMQGLAEGVPDPDDPEDPEKRETLFNVPSIYHAARAAGRANRAARDQFESLQQGDINFNSTLLVGGSVKGEKTRLFLVYSAGNFIECGVETPYLQIGEHKYGKPILDRAIRHDTSLDEAVKIGLISFSSTMRSNLAVGLPIDVMVAKSRQSTADLCHRIEEDDPYFHDLSMQWSQALRHAQAEIPLPPYRAAP